MTKLLLFVALATTSAIAHAGTCEATFIKQGNIVSGTKFIATTSVADLVPQSAIEQLHGVATARDYNILSEEAADGSMLLEQAQTEKSRAFPIVVSATSEAGVGTVRLEAQLRAGMSVKPEAARFELCGMLAELRGGKEGRALAAAARGKFAERPPLRMTALALSHQISKDTERNAAAVPLRYRHQSFTVDGTVDYVMKDGPYYRVAFVIPNPWEELIRLPNIAPFKTDISCLMAPGQAALALTLKPGKVVKFTGKFHEFSESRHIMWLADCRPAL
jgi:hypothetical protein